MLDRAPLKIERKIQVNVTINSNLLLDWAPFYCFYSGLRKRKYVSQFLTDFHKILAA